MKQNRTKLMGEIDSSTVIVGDFNTPLTIMDITTRPNISKEIEDLNNAVNQPAHTNIKSTLPNNNSKRILLM